MTGKEKIFVGLVWFAALVLLIVLIQTVRANHNGDRLYLIPDTPVIRALWENGEVTWGIDERASNYPNFLQQAIEVNDYAERVSGIPHRFIEGRVDGDGFWKWDEVPDVVHIMPNTFPCGSQASACVEYWKAPVIVSYNYRRGYFSWQTAQCHEGTNSGHTMGLPEYYDDAKFVSHLNTYGVWGTPTGEATCMDFGTGVWQMTAFDVREVWGWLLPRGVSSGWVDEELGRAAYCVDVVHDGVDRAALMIDGEWSGRHLSVPARDGGCIEFDIDSNKGGVYSINLEISAWRESWVRGGMRNDTAIGEIHKEEPRQDTPTSTPTRVSTPTPTNTAIPETSTRAPEKTATLEPTSNKPTPTATPIDVGGNDNEEGGRGDISITEVIAVVTAVVALISIVVVAAINMIRGQ